MVQWNRHKKVYDLVIVGLVVLYLVVFVVTGLVMYRSPNEISPPILLMRALGTCAFILLHVILLIGPMTRLSDAYAPLMYNRRHLGVVFFLVCLLHALVAVGFYGGFGVRNPLSATLAGYDSFGSVSGMPFEVFGFAALLIFFVMAATSHDFWLKNLSPRVWKSLHMLVYVAYGLVVAHVLFGRMMTNGSEGLVMGAVVIGGVVLVTIAHIGAGMKEWRSDTRGAVVTGEWVDIGGVDEFVEGRGRAIAVRGGERVAVFRHGGCLSAMSNVCAHQGGPLGEGRIVDGCVTCPWHGYQYRPEDGQSPPPYTEKIPTYELRVEGGRVLLNPEAKAPGTRVEPARIGGAS